MNILFTVFALLSISPLFSEEGRSDRIQSAAGYRQTFLLPLEESDKAATKLCVTIADGFDPIQPLDQFAKKDETLLEYIPKGESPSEWSEIISLYKFIGNKIPAIAFSSELIRELFTSTGNTKLLYQAASRKKPVQQAYFIAQYTLQEHTEIIGAAFFSGSHDCAGIQYTIRLTADESSEAIQKIDAFFKNHVRTEFFNLDNPSSPPLTVR